MLLPTVSSTMVSACPVQAQCLGARAPMVVEQDSRSGSGAGQTLQPPWMRKRKDTGTENMINTGERNCLKKEEPGLHACLVYLGAGKREERQG